MKFVIKEKVGPRNKLVFPFYAAIFWLAVPTGVLGFLASVTKIEWIYSLALAFFVPLTVLTIPVWPDALKLSKIKKNCGSKEERFTVVFQQTTDLGIERLRIENGLD